MRFDQISAYRGFPAVLAVVAPSTRQRSMWLAPIGTSYSEATTYKMTEPGQFYSSLHISVTFCCVYSLC